MLKKLDMESVHVVQEWWKSLPDSARVELVVCYREEPLMAGVIPFDYEERRTMEMEQSVTGTDGEVNDFYEYLVNHEGWEGFRLKSFHVCQAHPVAEKVLQEGVLKQGFVCPLGQESGQCPLQQIIDHAPGRSFILLPH
jgi:hypothetical protein